VNVIGTSQMMSSACAGEFIFLDFDHRQKGRPLARWLAGFPLASQTKGVPVLTPAGIVIDKVRVSVLKPEPPHVGHGVAITSPRPRQADTFANDKERAASTEM